MAIKEHPFVATTTFKGDGVTIKYDTSNRIGAMRLARRIE